MNDGPGIDDEEKLRWRAATREADKGLTEIFDWNVKSVRRLEEMILSRTWWYHNYNR